MEVPPLNISTKALRAAAWPRREVRPCRAAQARRRGRVVAAWRRRGRRGRVLKCGVAIASIRLDARAYAERRNERRRDDPYIVPAFASGVGDAKRFGRRFQNDPAWGSLLVVRGEPTRTPLLFLENSAVGRPYADLRF
jgi:hypothetical protein